MVLNACQTYSNYSFKMSKNKTRRGFLKMAGQALVIAPVASSMVGCSIAKSSTGDTESSRLEKQTIGGKEESKLILNVRDFGAIGDGNTKDTASIQQAIDRCWILGGGEVLVPPGDYL